MNGRLLVAGAPFFLDRHRPLTDALAARLASVREVPIEERAPMSKAAFLAQALLSGRLWPPTRFHAGLAMQRFAKRPATFDRLSHVAARALAETNDPAFVLQFFSMSSPVTETSHRPYAHYIDMTMAQVRVHWPAWAPFDTEAAYDAWIAREGASYRGAARVFTFSDATRRSVIEDYGADPARVVAVGAAGFYTDRPALARSYGNRTLIFNGSDFERKGGDRVLAAFRLVRERFPEAALTIVAASVPISEPGVRSLGKVDRNALFDLFDVTDVVLAPARWEGFPGFVLEAMSRGVVAVLSDSEPMNELVIDGVEGYVVSPPTAPNLAARVIRLFEDESALRTVGAAGRARIAEDWNWPAVADRILTSLSDEIGCAASISK